jgi:dinuclear metal center YbgI/SA1388 family protein
MLRDDLVQYLSDYLNITAFKDAGYNGLQVEGRPEIRKVVTGVSACRELFQKAIEKNVDAIIVHHGILWDFERLPYKGSYKARVKMLLEHELNLLAYHLPLDAHPELGNNAQLLKILAVQNPTPFGEYHGNLIGFQGELHKRAADIFEVVRTRINPDALILPYGPDLIRTVGIISGGGQKELRQAIDAKLDLYITGEASEYNFHLAKEEEIHFIAAGHHATERFGVRALGEHLSKLGLEIEFVDIANPV